MQNAVINKVINNELVTMQIHTLDKAQLISEVQLGDNLNQAVIQGRRRDFALMLALLSSDATETTPLNPPYPDKPTQEQLRKALNVPEPIRLTAQEKDYLLCADQANAFHQSGITSTRLNYYTAPSALCFPATQTYRLGEEVYHNISGHLRRKLAKENHAVAPLDRAKLYQELVESRQFLSKQV